LRPGGFDVKITYAANNEWTGKSYEYKTVSLDTIRISQPGRHKLLMRPAKKLDNDLMYFRALELVPTVSESS